MAWSDEKREALRQLWADGVSSRQIAAKLGCTHNAVVGQARRLDLPYRAGPKASKAAQSALSRRAGVISAKRKRTGTATPSSDDAYKRQYERVHKAMLAKDAEAKGRPLQDLGERDCRWPLRDGLFCGEKKLTLLSYCEAHARRAYVPLPISPTMSQATPARATLGEKLLVREKVEAA